MTTTPKPVVLSKNGVTIGYAEGVEFSIARAPGAVGDAVADALGEVEVSGTMQAQFADRKFYDDARRKSIAEFKLDVGPMLDRWIESPILFAEKVVLNRTLSQWERRRISNIPFDIMPLPSDRLDALRMMASAIQKAVGKSPASARRLRKEAHLELVRNFRRRPDYFLDVTYRHRWIRARCGKCRTLFATETFVNFTSPDGRRQYAVERESLLDCGHPSFYLHPLEWESDGLPIAGSTT